uniref:Uncharacterized protein n=1 Tax=Anopheles dirus TaxID=7168 RepID=A0A182N2D2_9DIPT
MRNVLSSVYFSTGILQACHAIPIPYVHTGGQHDAVLIGVLACLGLGSFIMGFCIFCKKKSGKFKKFKDGDIIQEVIATEYPILKALNVLDSSVPCAVIPSSPNNLSTDNLLDKIETYQIDVDHRHDSYCTRRSDPLTCTYDEFDPNDESDERTERTATTATVEPVMVGDEPLLFSDVFDESLERSEKCNLTAISVAPPTSSGEEDDEGLPATRSDAEDEDERRPLVSDESIDEAAATTATTITVTATAAPSADDAISIEEALRALDIAIEGEEDEDEDEGQATPLNESDDGSLSPSIYSEPPAAENAPQLLHREDVEQQAAELVDDVLYQCQYVLQMMDANGSNLSPLEADDFSPTNSPRGSSVFDGWGNLELDANVMFAEVVGADGGDDWWKGSLEPFDGEEEQDDGWSRAGNDPFQDDQAFDLLRQQLSQLLPLANDCGGAGGTVRTHSEHDQALSGSPKAFDNGADFERPERETEENEIIINYNRSLSPILEENEDDCSLPPSTSVAHCSNFVESTVLSTEGPVVCEATESVPALARKSSLTASNDTLFNLEDVLEDRCLTPPQDDTFPPASSTASPRTTAPTASGAAGVGELEKLTYTFSPARLIAPASGLDDHHLLHNHHLHHHHVLLSSICLEDLDVGDIMETPLPPPTPPPLPGAIGVSGGSGNNGGNATGLLMAETKQDLPSSA